VGCQVDLLIKDDHIFRVEAPFEVAPNFGRLCAKGRFGMDFVNHPSRLTQPLIRKDIGEKPRKPVGMDGFREATWDEALDLAAEKLAEISTSHGNDAIGTFCSAKATNEDNYLFQKFVRGVMGTNNVDHCARLCHAASVAGLQIAIGSSAMSNSIAEMSELDVFIVTGSNTSETHPVISTFLREAVVRGEAKLIVIDPRGIEMTEFATLWLRQKPGTDVAVFQAMAHVIVEEGLVNLDFIDTRTEGFEDYKLSLLDCTPEWAESVSRVPADLIRDAARTYAKAKTGAIYWGMGISQSVHGTDNTLTLANLALLTGHIGKPGTGLNPLRGQNNVQGCSDSGGLPNVFPGYQRIDDPEIRNKFEVAWGIKTEGGGQENGLGHQSSVFRLSDEVGLTTMEMVDAADNGHIRAYYVMGENPMMSEPDLRHARQVMEKLDFVLVQDIFLNETGEFADIILPATSFAEKDGTFTNSDRRVQKIRKALPAPGEAWDDWVIISELAKRVEEKLGRKKSIGFEFEHPSEIWDEMARLTPDFQGINYERLERRGGVHWPCPSPEHPGTPFLFTEEFPRGKGQFTPIEFRPSAELPSNEYPLILSTGRVLYHWHGGTMTRRSQLDHIYPEAIVEINPEDARQFGVQEHARVRLRSRRGQIEVKAQITERSPEGTIFIPFHFAEAAANILTHDVRDPQAKIPDYKVCAVAIDPIAESETQPSDILGSKPTI